MLFIHSVSRPVGQSFSQTQAGSHVIKLFHCSAQSLIHKVIQSFTDFTIHSFLHSFTSVSQSCFYSCLLNHVSFLHVIGSLIHAVIPSYTHFLVMSIVHVIHTVFFLHSLSQYNFIIPLSLNLAHSLNSFIHSFVHSFCQPVIHSFIRVIQSPIYLYTCFVT